MHVQGILDQAGRRTLSKLIYCLFTPALTFSKLAPVLSAAHLVAWMPLVINMFVR
jgi:predicted permease